VTAAFGLGGALCGVLTARIPALMDELAISPGQLGAVLFLWGLGGVASTQVLRWVMARTGSAPVLRVAAPVYALALVLVAYAPTYGMLLAAIAVFGADSAQSTSPPTRRRCTATSCRHRISVRQGGLGGSRPASTTTDSAGSLGISSPRSHPSIGARCS
jgi:hypothetical protein